MLLYQAEKDENGRKNLIKSLNLKSLNEIIKKVASIGFYTAKKSFYLYYTLFTM